MSGDRGQGSRVPTAAVLLGAAGLLPPLLALFVRLAAGADPESQLPGMVGALALIYSAVILSFLGGIWWGVAVVRAPMEEQASLFGLAVVPSILAVLLVGLSLRWPVIASTLLGLVIFATPLVDRALRARQLLPPWWMRLRVPLSLALGALTIGLGLLIG